MPAIQCFATTFLNGTHGTIFHTPYRLCFPLFLSGSGFNSLVP